MQSVQRWKLEILHHTIDRRLTCIFPYPATCGYLTDRIYPSLTAVQCNSLHITMVSSCSEKPTCAPPRVKSFPDAAFGAVPVLVWLIKALSRPLKVNRGVLPLSTLVYSPPSDRWGDAPGIVPAGSVSSSSTPQNFRDASHLWWFRCPLFLSARWFPLTLAEPGRYICGSLPRWKSNTDTRPSCTERSYATKNTGYSLAPLYQVEIHSGKTTVWLGRCYRTRVCSCVLLI